MKATIELPENLVEELRERARRDECDFETAIAKAIEAGLAVDARSENEELAAYVIERDEMTGLPVICGGHPARPGEELTPARIGEILLEQEIEWYAKPR